MSINKRFNNAIVPCKRCVFVSYEQRGKSEDADTPTLAFCRLDPPQVVPVNGGGKTMLPIVRPDLDGCGQGETADEFEQV